MVLVVVSHEVLEAVWVWNATLRQALEMQCPANLFFHVGQV